MGSWNWLKKNPFHALKLQALFHPIKRHRIRRVLRRHAGLFDFLTRAAMNGEAWQHVPTGARAAFVQEAERLWGRKHGEHHGHQAD
jgi:hypothetical protein